VEIDRREEPPASQPVPGSIENPEEVLEDERGALTLPDRVILVSAFVLFASSFLPWFADGGFTRSGWENFLSLLAILLGLSVGGVVALEHYTDVTFPMLSITVGEALFRASLVATGMILLQLLIGDSFGPQDLGVQPGALLGFLATVGLAGGGWLRRQDDAVYD
jgi:hypothetical protein